jgi:hypothetical protein
MNERTRKRIVYTIFAGAVILGLIARPWERPHDDPDAAAVNPVAALVEPNTATLSPLPPSVVGVTLERRELATTWPRDPFRDKDNRVDPALAEVAAMPESAEPLLTLQGVMTVDGQRVCVINGRVGRVGTVIEGWRVQRIDESRVHLVRGQEAVDLDLP